MTLKCFLTWNCLLRRRFKKNFGPYLGTHCNIGMRIIWGSKHWFAKNNEAQILLCHSYKKKVCISMQKNSAFDLLRKLIQESILKITKLSTKQKSSKSHDDEPIRCLEIHIMTNQSDIIINRSETFKKT